MTTNIYQPHAEFLYVTNHEEEFLAIRDAFGTIYPLSENFSLVGSKFYTLKDNSLLLLQNKGVTLNGASRAKEMGLEELFEECSEDLRQKIDSAHITLQ